MQSSKSKLDTKEIIYELKEDPLRKFRIAFALMSIIPLLSIFYLLVVKFFSFSIFIGNPGLILLLIIGISVLGFALGYNIIFRLLKKMMRYTAKLKENDQLKSAFVVNVSQQVHNPLSVVKLTLVNLFDGVGGQLNKMQKGVVKRCQETIERLIRLVNQLLDLSEIEAGKFIMKRALIDMNLLIDNELSNLAFSLKSKNLQLDRQTPALPIKIWGDHTKISQVLVSLFDNAVKYTPQNGKISVRLSDLNGDARLEIEDTGRGIPEEKLRKIFDKFERIQQKENLGTGLRLPLARDIVQMHRGRIWAESQAGKGSKFVIVLPKDLRSRQRTM